METNALSELIPLFNTTNPDILQWILSVGEEQNYPKDSIIITEDNWGKAVFFLLSGWVKIQHHFNEQEITVDICAKGDYFGDMAVIDESPRSTTVIALSDVTLLSLSAQRFLQMLYKDTQLHQRMLQLTVRRVRQFYRRCQLKHYSAKVRLVKTLITIAENYGQFSEKGTKILAIPAQDLGDLAGITEEETGTILEKLSSNGWIEIDQPSQTLFLVNLKQLNHLVKQR